MYKKILPLAIAFILAAGVLSPITAQAAQDTQSLPAEVVEALTDQFQGLADIFGVNTISLTPEAQAYALSDFVYLADKLVEVLPTQNIVMRRGLDLVTLLDLYYQIIYNNIPVPSIAGMFMGERWPTTPTGTMYIAADYLFSALLLLAVDLGSLGHMEPQVPHVVHHYLFGAAHTLHNNPDEPQEVLQMWQLYYDILSAPSVLWFYDIDPAEFDMDGDLLDVVGLTNPDNITTDIIEPDYIAYLHIACFLNNIVLDSQTLFPFFQQIQDYQHLIIDLRGNAGGMVTSFPTNVISMLIDEPISFSYAEFFIAHDLTADFFEFPSNASEGSLYGVVPAREFVQANNMHQFEASDLALLDYALIWEIEIHPATDNIPFGGEIWILVDGTSASASEMAAKIAINTGFATVVGEPTAGVTFVTHTFAALSNTGIVFRIDLGYTVDIYGRSIEEFGVIPQIPNNADMDALETVLSIIGFALEGVDTSPQDYLAGIPHVYVGGVAFVPVRMTAYAFGWTVEWDQANSAAILVDDYGNAVVLTVSTYRVFIEGGTMFMPLEYVAQFFVAA